MRWFGSLRLWLQRINKRSSKTNLFQFIPLLLNVPCFEVSNFFFVLSYGLNQPRAFILQRRQRVLGLADVPLELYLPLP